MWPHQDYIRDFIPNFIYQKNSAYFKSRDSFTFFNQNAIIYCCEFHLNHTSACWEGLSSNKLVLPLFRGEFKSHVMSESHIWNSLVNA